MALRSVLAAAAAALAFSIPALGQPDPLSPEAEVQAAEQRRYQAMVAVDIPALEKLLGEELRYTHANGNSETKYEFIASLESRNLDYQLIEASDSTVHVYGDAATVTGRARLRVASRGTRQKFELVFTAVHVRRDGAWQLVAYQSTRSD
jgi:ketosteroid isomerase-like protein